MHKTLTILGRQPAIGLAEIESLFGRDHVMPFGDQATFIDINPTLVDLAHLGGSQRVCEVIVQIRETDWTDIERYLIKNISGSLLDPSREKNKFTFGISVYGASVPPVRIGATALKLKKILRKSGRPVRAVPNKTTALSAAQVLHNKLTSANGLELTVVSTKNSGTVIARTVSTQDIEAYTARDQARPMRDARVGMLPPKLAQIVVNLAVGKNVSIEENGVNNVVVLDPFCGTGVLLQEALLMGFDACGTDLEPRMIEYSKVNLEWLGVDATRYKLELADATHHIWEPPPTVIASELYLGRPFSSMPTQQVLKNVMQDVDTIFKKFLVNIGKQLSPGTSLCLAVPAWKTKSGFIHLPSIDSLEKMDYNRHSFVHVNTNDLIYHRADQIVGRELLVLSKM